MVTWIRGEHDVCPAFVPLAAETEPREILGPVNFTPVAFWRGSLAVSRAEAPTSRMWLLDARSA